MYYFKTTLLPNGHHHYVLYKEVEALSFREVIKLWHSSSAFRTFYNQILAESPFVAFFWEHPPLTVDLLDREYEFVLVDSPSLREISATPARFAGFFREDQGTVDFLNLGGDAHLLVPCPVKGMEFQHLAAFCRTALPNLIDEYWRALGELLIAKIGTDKRWLSTSGLGVYWLHVRWDSVPKYYKHAAYR